MPLITEMMRNATFTKQNYGTLQAGQKNQNILSPVVKVQRERERERERERGERGGTKATWIFQIQCHYAFTRQKTGSLNFWSGIYTTIVSPKKTPHTYRYINRVSQANCFLFTQILFQMSNKKQILI